VWLSTWSGYQIQYLINADIPLTKQGIFSWTGFHPAVLKYWPGGFHECLSMSGLPVCLNKLAFQLGCGEWNCTKLFGALLTAALPCDHPPPPPPNAHPNSLQHKMGRYVGGHAGPSHTREVQRQTHSYDMASFF